MLFQVDVVDDAGRTTETEIFDIPQSLALEMSTYLLTGEADGDLWTCLTEVRIRDDTLAQNMTITSGVPHELGIGEVGMAIRRMLLAEVLRMYHEDEYKVLPVTRLTWNFRESHRMWLRPE